MAARKSNAKRGKKRATQKRQQPSPRKSYGLPSRSQLDVFARDYAALVADPCGARLVEGVYPGGGGGLVSRFESDFVAASGGTDQAFAVAFAPGFNSELAGLVGGMVQTPSIPLVADTSVISFTNNFGIAPGFAFLANNAKAFRSVSACLQISWPGSELTRQGIVGLGQATLSNTLGGTVSTASLRTLSTHVGRMPDDVIEIVLRPTEASQRWCDPTLSPTLAVVQEVWGDSPLLFATIAGIPPNVGVRVRLVNIVEWLPASNTGVAGLTAMAPRSRNTLTDVLHYLEGAMNNKWVRKVGMAALNYATGGVGGNLLRIRAS